MGIRRFSIILISLFVVSLFITSLHISAARRINIENVDIQKNVRFRMRRLQNNNPRYNIFHNSSLKHFKITNNPIKINAKLPRMKHVISFPTSFKRGRWPQSLNVDPKGHYAYLGFDSFDADGSEVVRYNFRHRHFTTGKVFKGGHAQAVNLSPRDHNLWFIDRTSDDNSDDHAGPINKGSFVAVSPRSLKPVYRKYFKFGHEYLGDNLAFTDRYGVFNASRIWSVNRTNKKYKRRMLVFYHSNQLNRLGSYWNRVQALKHLRGLYTIQAMSYNPRSKRLYIASSDPSDILSVPVVKLLNHRLDYHDVQVASITLPLSNSEVEGIAFDQNGYLYMLFAPGELFKSRTPIVK